MSRSGIVEPAGGPLSGSVRAPGDKSISHRAVMLSSVSHGESVIEGFLQAEDTLSTVGVFRALGVPIEVEGSRVVVQGDGPGALRAAAEALDCGNSGTTMRLVTGLLAGVPGFGGATLIGDASLSRRPMGRIAEPLNDFGARVLTDAGRPPIKVEAGDFKGGAYRSPVASAQVKSALLLAGLMAGVEVEIVETSASRDHTESLLRAMGVPVASSAHYGAEVAGEARVSLPAWGGRLEGRVIEVPGDISSAAFLMVAAAIVPGSAVEVRGCGVAWTRAGVLGALERAGVRVERRGARVSSGGEPTADLRIAHGALRGFEIEPHQVPSLIDEIPVLAVLAGRARGRSVFRGVGELRVKESDRLALTAGLLEACGCAVETGQDWLAIQGRGEEAFERFEFDAAHDHRMAAAATVAALVAEGPCRVDGLESLSISYPEFFNDLKSLQREEGE